MRSVLIPYGNSYASTHEISSFHPSAILQPTLSCELASLNVNYSQGIDNYLNNFSNNFVLNDCPTSLDSKRSEYLKMNKDHTIPPLNKPTSFLRKTLSSTSDLLHYNTQVHTKDDVCIRNEELLVNNENSHFTSNSQMTNHMESDFVKYYNMDSNAPDKHHETMVNYDECHSVFCLPEVSPASIFHHSDDRSNFYNDLSKDSFHEALHATLKKDEKYMCEQYSEESTFCPFENTRNNGEKPFFDKNFISSPSYTSEDINFIEPCKNFSNENELRPVSMIQNDLTQCWGESNAQQDTYCVKPSTAKQWPYQTVKNSTTHDDSKSHLSSECHALTHACNSFTHQDAKKKPFQDSHVIQDDYRSSLYKSFLTKTYSSPTVKIVQPNQQDSWLYSSHATCIEKDTLYAEKTQNYAKHDSQKKNNNQASIKNNTSFHYMTLLNTSKTSGDTFSNPFLQTSCVPLQSSSPPLQPSCLVLKSPCVSMKNSSEDSTESREDHKVERDSDINDLKKNDGINKHTESSFCDVSSNDCLHDCVKNCMKTDSHCNIFSIDRKSGLQNNCLPQDSNEIYEKTTTNECEISDTQDLVKVNVKAFWMENQNQMSTVSSQTYQKNFSQERFCFDDLKMLGVFLAHIYTLYQHSVSLNDCKNSSQDSVSWLSILDHYAEELLDYVTKCSETEHGANHVFLCKSSETVKEMGNDLIKHNNNFQTFQNRQSQESLVHTFCVLSGVQDDKFLQCVADWYQVKCHKGLSRSKTLKNDQVVKPLTFNKITDSFVHEVQEKPQPFATPKMFKHEGQETCESTLGSYRVTKLFSECLQTLKELNYIFGDTRYIQGDISLSLHYLQLAIGAYRKHDLQEDAHEEKIALKKIYQAKSLHEAELDSLVYSDSTCTGKSRQMCETGRCEKTSCFYDVAPSTPRIQRNRHLSEQETLDNRVDEDGEQEKGTDEIAQKDVSQKNANQEKHGKESGMEREFYASNHHGSMLTTQNISYNSLPDHLSYKKASLLDTKKNLLLSHQRECLLILSFLEKASPQWAAQYHSREWHSHYVSQKGNECIEMYMKIFLPQESFFAFNTMSCHNKNSVISSSLNLPMKKSIELICLWFNRLDCFRLSHEPNFEPFFPIPSVEQKNYSQSFLSLSSDILNRVNFFLNHTTPEWKKYLNQCETKLVFSYKKGDDSITPCLLASPCHKPSFLTPYKYPERKCTNTEHSSESICTMQTSNDASVAEKCNDIPAVKNSILKYSSLHDPPLVSFQKYEIVSTCATPARLSMASLNSTCQDPQEDAAMTFTPNLGEVTRQGLSPVKRTHERKRRMVVTICTARPCSLSSSNETNGVKNLPSPPCKKLCLVTEPHQESSVPNSLQQMCEKTCHTTLYNSFMCQPNNTTPHDVNKNESNPFLASSFVSPTTPLNFKNEKFPTQKQLHDEDKMTRLSISKKKKVSLKQQKDASLELQRLQTTSTSDVFSSYPTYSDAIKTLSNPTQDLRVMWNPQENAWVVTVAKEFSSLAYPIFCSFPVSKYGADMARYLAFQWKNQHDSVVLEQRLVPHPSIVTNHQTCEQTKSTTPCKITHEKKSCPTSPGNHTLPCKNTTQQQRSTSRSSKYTTNNTRANTTCHSRNPPKSEIPGVYWYRNRNGWVAQWFEKGKNKHKFFAASAFGIEGAKEKAIAYRLMKLEEKRLKGW